MRTYKFRAWDKERKEMYIFDLDSFNSDDGSHWLNCENNKILYYGGLEWGNCELMQFTGLKDKNGKEIYEGDIVRNEHGVLFTVEWHSHKYVLRYAGYGAFNTEIRMKEKLEVIGNIHENPELLIK